MNRLFSGLIGLGCAVCSTSVAAEDVRLFSVGSGDISGNYYPVARLLCDAFNMADDTRRRCSPEPSAGSIYNLAELQRGDIEFAIVQSDWQRAAFNGTGPFAGAAPMSDLRVVAPLFPETITVLAARGTGIVNARDLAGKVVDIGRPASGRNATIRAFFAKLSLGDDFFAGIKELEPAASVVELCEGSVDAVIFVVGHPSALVAEALTECGATLAVYDGPVVTAVLAESRDYQPASIDLALYGLPGAPVPAVSVMASLVTRSTTEDGLVRDMRAALAARSAQLAIENPVLRLLPELVAAPPELGVPMHPAVGSPQ